MSKVREILESEIDLCECILNGQSISEDCTECSFGVPKKECSHCGGKGFIVEKALAKIQELNGE